MLKKLFFSIAFTFFSVASFSQGVDVLHYKYEIELNDKNDSIYGVATIKMVFRKEQGAIRFDLKDVGADGKGMSITDVALKGPRDRPEYYTDLNKKTWAFLHTGDSVLIPIFNYVKGDTAIVKIWYKGIPDDGLIIAKSKYGDRTFFADNWPNRAHHWIPCVDRPNDKASFEFIVTAPSQYKVISNGEKIEEKDLGNGLSLTHWKEDTPLPTKVMVIGVAKFAVKTFPDSPPNIPVSAWVYQQDSTKGFYDYAPAPEILKFFSNYIGPYPYEKLANVQSKTIFGGMENASAIFYFEGSVTGKGGVEDLLAHEIAHQWFGDMASEKSFTHLWLSEGFATYFTDIYWQHKYGDEAFKKRLQKERDQVIEFAKSNDHPVVDSLSSYMDLLNANSYQKGAWILHMLRNEVGDSVFHKIIQVYYQQYKGSNADTRDFEKVAEKVSGKNLKWFFDQWLYQPGIPQLIIERSINKDEIKINITQKGQAYIFPLEIAIIRRDGSSSKQKVIVNNLTTEFKMKVQDVQSVIIDPDTKLLYSETRN